VPAALSVPDLKTLYGYYKMSSLTKESLQQILARLRAARAAPQAQAQAQAGAEFTDRSGKPIIYNSKQAAFVSLISRGQSCVLIGSAGTGKSTAQHGGILELIKQNLLPILNNTGHKHLQDGLPGVAICAFTRRAVQNIASMMSEDLANNCLTIHKLLEFQPENLEILDPITGDTKTVKVFKPSRTESNPLPQSLKCIIFEESSMVGVDLYKKIINALPGPIIEIFLGDLAQIPPVFGSSILGYKLLELPVIELTEIYRQALDSPIISLATKIRTGKWTERISEKLFLASPDGSPDPSTVTIIPWKKSLDKDVACEIISKQLCAWADAGIYSPESDVILTPFNVSFGTIEINKHIANHLARVRGEKTYEIIAGLEKAYLSVGDKVLYDKSDAVVLSIHKNSRYLGRPPQEESLTLNYHGQNSSGEAAQVPTALTLEEVDRLLERLETSEDEKFNQASHVITLLMEDSGEETSISTVGEVGKLLLGYALTIHKAQGSEWGKVFLVTHKSQNSAISRELIYTAITRARKDLWIVCDPDMLTKAANSPRIPGVTWQEKAKFFKGKLDFMESLNEEYN
jgi:hypothetical protein